MKRVVAYVISFIMIGVLLPCNSTSVSALDNDILSNPITSKAGGAVYDCIYFGEYPQSSDGSGGYVSEPIKWRVLSVEGNEVMLISDYVLDMKPYCEKYTETDKAVCTWANSTFRKWLNGYSDREECFFNTAFSSTDQDAIIAKKTAVDSVQKETDLGSLNIINDKVSCLSYEEVYDNKMGFDFEKYPKFSDLAEAKLRAEYPGEDEYFNYYYFLRSTKDTEPGKLAYYRDLEQDMGVPNAWEMSVYGVSNDTVAGVRPLIYLDIQKADWEYAGEKKIAGGVVQNAELQDPRVDPEGSTTWDVIHFGNNVFGDGRYDEKYATPIEWRVLSVDDDVALLISDTTIYISIFNIEKSSSEWDDSYLRKVLNTKFIESAFTETEKDAIIAKKITNPDNPDYETDSGVATKDKVYVLSVNEARNDDYGFRNTKNNSDTRTVGGQHTVYYEMDIDEHEVKYANTWWLRTSGENKTKAAYVTSNGTIDTKGTIVNDSIGVRPVINLDLTAPVWKYVGTKTAGKLGNATNLSVSSTGNNSVTLKWKEAKNADGYKIYRYNAQTGKFVLLKTIKGGTSTSCVIKNLTAGSGYKFKIRPYMGKKPVYGNFSKVVSAVTKPLKVTINKPTTGKTHYVKVTWKKRNCTGYEVKLATNSKFTKGVKNYKVKSSKTLSKKFTGLKKGKRYYVKVRAYKTYNGITKYGSWSSWKSVYCK